MNEPERGDRHTQGALDESTAQVCAYVVLGLSSMVTNFLIPITVGAISETLALTVGGAGLMAVAEVGGWSAGSFVAALRIHCWDRRLMGLGSVMVILIGQLISILAGEAATMWSGRLIAGVGSGVLGATMFATMGATTHPERNFALQFTATTGAMVVLFPAMSIIGERFGSDGLFLSYSLLTVAISPALAFLPRRTATSIGTTTQGGLNLSAATTALSGLLLCFMAHGSVWTYVERIGSGIGLNATQIGLVLSASAAFGLFAGTCSALLATRVKRLMALSAGILTTLLCALCIVLVAHQWWFACSVVLFYGGWLFSMPYVLGTLASLDPHGRIVALGASLQTAGLACGPALAANFLQSSEFQRLAWLAFTLYAGSLVLLNISSRSHAH